MLINLLRRSAVKAQIPALTHPFLIQHAIRVWTIWILPLMLAIAVPARVQGQFLYTNINGTITITGYTGPGGAVTIPSMINGLPVTRIGDWAFDTQTNLTDITSRGSGSKLTGLRSATSTLNYQTGRFNGAYGP